jgi:D-sedoheptulose 7-phosphate isomerase
MKKYIREYSLVYMGKKIMSEDNYISAFLNDAVTIIRNIDQGHIKKMSKILQDVRKNGGRLFILGVGGGAGHASHAVNDFRKIAGIESYAPTDNVSELTARVNDDGWETVFESWLKGSRLTAKDCVFVFSVGGGNSEKKVSVNLVNALQYAKKIGAKVIGVVGRDGGYTAKVADACVIIPTVNEKTVTPQTEAFQAVVWHLIVSSPAIQKFEMKWESTK